MAASVVVPGRKTSICRPAGVASRRRAGGGGHRGVKEPSGGGEGISKVAQILPAMNRTTVRPRKARLAAIRRGDIPEENME